MTLKTKRNIKKFAKEYFEKKKKEMGAINSTIINEILDTIIFDYDIPADEWSKVEDILWDVFEDVYEERDPFSNGIDESLEKKTCVLCGKEFTGYGNNAFPLADGICCDECNNKVIMARLNLHEEKGKSDKIEIKIEVIVSNEVEESIVSGNPEDKYDDQTLEEWYDFASNIEGIVERQFIVKNISLSKQPESLSEYMDFYRKDKDGNQKDGLIDLRLSDHKSTANARQLRKKKASKIDKNYRLMSVIVNKKQFDSYEEALHYIEELLNKVDEKESLNKQDIPLEEVKMEDKIYSIYVDKSYDSSTLESVANANDVEYRKTEDKIFLKGQKEDLLYVLDFADYELEDENDLVLEESIEKKPDTVYKGFTIEHFPTTWKFSDKGEEHDEDGYIIKSPYYLQSNSNKDKYYLPLYIEDEYGNDLNLSSLEDAKKYIDTYMTTKKGHIEIKHGNEVHFVLNDDVRKDLDELELKESLKEEDEKNESENAEEESKPESVLTNDMSGVSLLLNNLIKDEFDAIDQYNSAITTLQSEGLAEDILGILYDIVAEENTHVGQLQKALELINPTAVENIKDGEQEAEEQINKE